MISIANMGLINIICIILAYFLVVVNSSKIYDYKYKNVHDDVDSELLMSFMVLRHGDRTPVKGLIPFARNQEKVLYLTQKIGFGQLTDAGKRRSYKTGAFIRNRYDSLLSPTYNQSEIYIKSTDSTRTKMTALTAMYAVYPAKNCWCEDQDGCTDSNWTPIPYHSQNAKYDTNLGFLNCPVYIKHYIGALQGPVPEMSEYFKFLDEWSSLIDYNITKTPALAYLLYDAYISQISLGVPLEPRLQQILPKIDRVASAALNTVFGNEDYVQFVAGVLLNEFFKAADKVIAGENVPKVYVYSAHDINVYSFMKVTNIWPLPGVPMYGSLFALELRRVLATGQYAVVPVFLKTPEDNVITLKVEECDGLCELSKFHSLVSKYELNVTEWRRQCGWSEDYAFDFRDVD